MAIQLLEQSELASSRMFRVNFVIFMIFLIFLSKCHQKLYLIAWGGDVGSTSPPSGNHVDGLPPASSTKTVAKWARRDGCTTMRRAMKK